jgi:flavorubredoxin/flavin reductase (DIM6/NTAB) family NADH-FMN oxidoreductase RutF
MIKTITKDIKYIGVDDLDIDLFEGQFVVKDGISYNSYVIDDTSIAILDTVDIHKSELWLHNLGEVLGKKQPEYVILQHMEPDHCGSLEKLLLKYKHLKVVGNSKTHQYIRQFFPDLKYHEIVVGNGQELNLGNHVLKFVFAPMVHWPEVFFTYDETEKVLFTADAFGSFGALERKVNWIEEARRYYFGIVGKYGRQVQAVLNVASTLNIEKILPLHGPVLEENLSYYLGLYNTWSSYLPEKKGILVVYTSIYGNTKEAINYTVSKFSNFVETKVIDLARFDIYEAIAQAFKYDTLLLASTTYNIELFPVMQQFLTMLKERNYSNRRVAIIENGTWAPNVINKIKSIFADAKEITYTKNLVTVLSAINSDVKSKLDALADELSSTYVPLELKHGMLDVGTLFNISYGLYVVTTNDGKRDNGLIVNTVTQVTNTPNRVAVTINKVNYSSDTILKTGKMNINILTTKTSFDIFKQFGFQSGREVDKFAGKEVKRSLNGLAVLDDSINGYISLQVVDKPVDLGTHYMFICDVVEAAKINSDPSCTYTYYQESIKPKPAQKKVGFVCTVCGFVYEGDELPKDYICPLCKHGIEAFEKL